nr:splicing factor [Tanacetum cinerariifolium]
MDVESYGRGGMGSGIRAMGTDSGGRGGRRGGGRGSTSILKQEKEKRDKLNEEALKQAREEDLMFKRKDLEREREEQQWKAMMDPLNDCRFPDEEECMDVEMYNITKASKKHHGEHS